MHVLECKIRLKQQEKLRLKPYGCIVVKRNIKIEMLPVELRESMVQLIPL
jgi:hypothetical protein